MRDLSAFDRLPSREALRARIARPERFRPEPQLVARVEIRPREDGFSDVLLADEPPRRVHPMVVEMYRGLEAGLPLADIVARAAPLWKEDKPRMVARLLRAHVLELAERGYVKLDFEEPPAVFGGRFERVKLLGRGAMGLVFLCRDREGGGEVVLKHAWGWSTAIEVADLMNRREAAALSVLDHPLVPGLVATFEHEGILHIARAFAPGSPLHHQAKETARMSSPERLAVARDLCEAVHHIHEAGLVYLDVKPENFVRSREDGRARLIDLGLCRPAPGGVVRLSSPIGSRGYAAPEVVRERVGTPRSDVYGVGRAMFHLATGARPREKHDGHELRALLLERGVDPREADIIGRMTAKDLALRPASLADVVADIDRARSGEAPTPDAR